MQPAMASLQHINLRDDGFEEGDADKEKHGENIIEEVSSQASLRIWSEIYWVLVNPSCLNLNTLKIVWMLS